MIKKLQKNKGEKVQNLAWLSQKWHFQIRPLYGRGTRRCPKVHSGAIANALYKYGIAIIFLGAGRVKMRPVPPFGRREKSKVEKYGKV